VACGSHGLLGKQNVYEYDSVRVPLIIGGPGIPAGRRTDAMCYLFDVLPTLGNLCGVAAPKGSDGIEFCATLHDPVTPSRSGMLFAYKDVQRAFCDERWKLICYPQVDKTQLFDLRADPQEATNLAYLPQYADKVTELTVRLEKEQRLSGDTTPLTAAQPRPAEWTPPAKDFAPKGVKAIN